MQGSLMQVLKSKSNVKSFGFTIFKYKDRLFFELKFGKTTWLVGF
jgi:hypothetical protein